MGKETVNDFLTLSKPFVLSDACKTVSNIVETEIKQLDRTMMEQGKPNERDVFYILRCYDLNWIEFV